MSNKNLFKEAIADAKAVREAALANAKAALEEALTPKLQSMLAAKLNEMEYEEEELEETKKSEEEKMEEGMYPDVTGDTIQDKYRATGAALEEADEEELEEDFDLSEILAELNEAEEKEEEEEETEETEEEEKEEEVEVKDMTIEDLKDLIKDIVSQEMGDEAPEMGAEEPMEMGGEEEMPAADGAEDEIDLEELLAELDSLDKSDELEEAKKKKDKEEKDKKKKMVKEAQLDEYINLDPEGFLAAITPAIPFVMLAAGGISALISKLRQKGVPEESIKAVEKLAQDAKKSTPALSTDSEPVAKELKEAISTINTLRNELNEVNLLNAKLLYVNKIFKAKNLNESQKLKVIAQFDKATTAKEAKTIFESMNSAIAKSKKSTLKESIGFASKAAGVAPKKPIVEVNETVSRWQMLAGITKF